MGIFKKKETVGEKALKIIAGFVGFEALCYTGGYAWERGEAKAIYDIRKTDPHYGYHTINFNVGVDDEDELPDEYADGYNVDLEDAFDRLGKRIRNKRVVDEIDADEDDEEDDDEEDIVDEEPSKIQPNKKG